MKLNIPQFDTKKELYKYLVANKAELIALKETQAYKECDVFSIDADIHEGVIKAINTNKLPNDDVEGGVIYRSVIPNTYYWLDSHDDVHVKGIFTKSIQENKSRIRHTHDHVQQITAKVAKVLDIYEKSVSWKDLGVNKEGKTICVISDSAIKSSYNKQIFDDYLANEIDQHSVEMIYQKMALAVNDPDSKDEYKEWNNVFPLLGNPERALEKGFFFVQKEAKLKAFSCVVEGSNSLTGTIEPSKDTQIDIEPTKSVTHDFSKIKFITI